MRIRAPAKIAIAQCACNVGRSNEFFIGACLGSALADPVGLHRRHQTVFAASTRCRSRSILVWVDRRSPPPRSLGPLPRRGSMPRRPLPPRGRVSWWRPSWAVRAYSRMSGPFFFGLEAGCLRPAFDNRLALVLDLDWVRISLRALETRCSARRYNNPSARKSQSRIVANHLCPQVVRRVAMAQLNADVPARRRQWTKASIQYSP